MYAASRTCQTTHSTPSQRSHLSDMCAQMATFQTLPEDLIYHIALNFEHDLAILHVLSQICQSFHAATRALLYRHVDAVVPRKRSLVLRSVHESPDLASLITSWFLSLDAHDANGVIPELITVLKFPNMGRLVLERSDNFYKIPSVSGGTHPMILRWEQLVEGRPATRDFECSFLDRAEHDLQNIHTIELRDQFTTTELLRFMLIPNVRTLKAASLDRMPPASLSATWSNQKSNISRLEIDGGWLWTMVPSTIHSILSHCPQLRVLHVRVPMVSDIQGGAEIYSQVNQPVIPAALQQMLEPVRHTLQELVMLNGRHKVPYDHSSTMNFSGFKALEKLEITSCCMMPPGSPCDARYGLSRSLPPKVRFLKVPDLH